MKSYHLTMRNGSVHQQFSPCLLQLHLALLYSVLQFSLSSKPEIELVPNQLLLALVYPHQSAWETIFGPSEAGWYFTKERWIETSKRHPGVSQRHARDTTLSLAGCGLSESDCNLIQVGYCLTEVCCPIPGGIYACTNACMDVQTYGYNFSLLICWSLWVPLCPLLRKVYCFPTELTLLLMSFVASWLKQSCPLCFSSVSVCYDNFTVWRSMGQFLSQNSPPKPLKFIQFISNWYNRFAIMAH